MAYPKFDKVEKIMSKGEDFTLTREEYQKLVGEDTPKDKYYLLHNAAIKKRADKFGFTLEVIPEVYVFKRISTENNSAKRC